MQSGARSLKLRLGTIAGGLGIAVMCCGFLAWCVPNAWGESAHLGRFAFAAAFFVRTFSIHLAWAALACVTFSFLAGRRWLATAAVPFPLIVLAPIIWSMLRTPPEPVQHPLRVMTANLLVGHGNVDEVVRLIRAQSPDIIFLQEYTPLKADRLVAAIGDQYPHRIEGMRDHAFGCAIYSRIPFKGEPNLYPHAALRSNLSARHFGEVGIWDPQPRAVIEHAGREIVLQNLHFAPPIRMSYLREQRLMTRWLCEWLGNEQRPVILAGDLNSTLASANLDDLRRCGVRSARSEAGRGSLGSWPSSGWAGILPVGIDHILYRGVRCDMAMVGPPIASDHLPLLAVLGD